MGIIVSLNQDGGITITDGSGVLRPEKGKSLLAQTEDFTAIDLETTGLSPTFDAIIELSAVRYREGTEVAAFDQLVDPGFEVDPFIAQLTGISNDMLKGMPQLGTVLPSFLDFLDSDVLIGHNVHFDVNFIYDACVGRGLPPLKNDFIDTMRMARRLYRDWPDHKLDTLIERLGLGSRSIHRAENDARLTAAAYSVMTKSPDFESRLTSTSYNAMAKSIVAREGFANENNPLYGKVCVFTGALEAFTRKEAMQLVADIGGVCGDGVTKKTNYLILGNNDYCKSIKDGKSSKQKKAEALILQGADLQIIPESVFLDMLADNYDTEGNEVENTLNPAQISLAALAQQLRLAIEPHLAGLGDLAKKITVAENVGYVALKAGSSLAAHISIRKNGICLSVKPKNCDLFPNTVWEPASNGLSRTCLQGLNDLLSLSFILCEIAVNSLSAGEGFGCCHLFEKCSDARACIQPDKLFALACYYKKNLEQGRIFYGKNKNN